MEKRIFVVGFFVCCIMFFSGCSMMPSDEEIINGSVLETEVFGEELVDDGLDTDTIINEFEENDENFGNENDEIVDDEEDTSGGDRVVNVDVM